MLGQDITAYSEFVSIDPFGNTMPAEPREILSPGLPRNGYASFRLAVDPGAEDKAYEVHVGLNPDDAVKCTLYREEFEQRDGRWVTVRLQPLPLPYTYRPKSLTPLEGRKVHVYWLDVFVPANATVERIKIQPEILYDGSWIEYPMEGRILPLRFPAGPSAKAGNPVCAALGQKPDTDRPAPLTPAWMHHRNAEQDARLIRQQPVAARSRMLQAVGVKDAAALCRMLNDPGQPEAMLRLRDPLHGALEEPRNRRPKP
jgi:hypothetical protein